MCDVSGVSAKGALTSDWDWEAMAEAAEEFHGNDFDDMPCHSEGSYARNWWGGMGGHMGRGMMSW